MSMSGCLESLKRLYFVVAVWKSLYFGRDCPKHPNLIALKYETNLKTAIKEL